MTIIPCKQDAELRDQIEHFAETLKTEAHRLGNHGLSEAEFYNGGLFRGAIELIRGQFSAQKGEKREFVQHILNHMQDRGFIHEWELAEEANRHDYSIRLNSGRIAIIELKGCLDGNNTTIFERPPHAQEFIVWSVCTNTGSNPRRSVWSGIHTRLSAEIISTKKVVDGVLIWDMLCGSTLKPCPKIDNRTDRITDVGPFRLPPPCIYVLPGTVPNPRNNPHPVAQRLEDVELLTAFNTCFQGDPAEANYVDFKVQYRGSEIVRTTRVTRGGVVQRESSPTAIRRT